MSQQTHRPVDLVGMPEGSGSRNYHPSRQAHGVHAQGAADQFSRRTLPTNAHRGVIHDDGTREQPAVQVAADKHSVVRVDAGTARGGEQDRGADTCYHTEGPGTHDAQRERPDQRPRVLDSTDTNRPPLRGSAFAGGQGGPVSAAWESTPAHRVAAQTRGSSGVPGSTPHPCPRAST